MNAVREYANGNSNSGIKQYKEGEGWIEVQFTDGSVYKYDNESTGESKIKLMKILAEVGKGLNSYINVHVRTAYAERVW